MKNKVLMDGTMVEVCTVTRVTRGDQLSSRLTSSRPTESQNEWSDQVWAAQMTEKVAKTHKVVTD